MFLQKWKQPCDAAILPGHPGQLRGVRDREQWVLPRRVWQPEQGGRGAAGTSVGSWAVGRWGEPWGRSRAGTWCPSSALRAMMLSFMAPIFHLIYSKGAEFFFLLETFSAGNILNAFVSKQALTIQNFLPRLFVQFVFSFLDENLVYLNVWDGISLQIIGAKVVYLNTCQVVIYWYPYCLNAYYVQYGKVLHWLLRKVAIYFRIFILIGKLIWPAVIHKPFAYATEKRNDSHDTHSFKRKKIIKPR